MSPRPPRFRPTAFTLRPSAFAALATLLLASAGARAQQPETEGLAGDPAWEQIGSFTGVRGASGIDLLANEVFRESRAGDLFQDLGDLQIAFGKDWDTIDTGLKANFKRRVVERHEALDPGSEVGPQDLAHFQTINSALGKLELGVDYLKDRFDPFAVGFQSEAGFVVTVAQTQPPSALSLNTSRRTHVGTTRQELSDYWNSHGVRFDRHILRDVGRGLVDFLGLIAGQVGATFEDTELGAQYFEGFVEPLTIWADLGVPLQPTLFEGPDSALKPGDAVSYLVFLEVAPLSAGMDKWGAQVNMKGFLRFLRETTIVALPGNQILLRVKNIAAQGVETTPLKIRPELRWYFLRYGYTFLADRFDNSNFRASQIVYHVDLNNSRAREAFALLLATGHKVRFKPLLEAAEANEGVRILSNSYLDGRRREHSFLARFPAWFRADRRNVSVVKTVETPTESYREATHARYNNFRQTWGSDRWRSARSVLTLQTERAPRAEEPPLDGSPASLVVSTQLRDKSADPRKLSYLIGLLRGVLGLDVPTPGIADVRRIDAPVREGATLSLDISLGREQIEHLEALDDATVWRALAEFYLGPALIDAWSTPARRSYWRFSGPVRAKTGPAAADIGRRIDAWLERNPNAQHGIGQLPDEQRGSRRLFLRAEGFVRRLHALQKKSEGGRLCLACWAGLYTDFQDATFLQLLLVRAGGGVGGGAVGYDAEIWTDSMFRPTRLSNGIVHGGPTGAVPATPNPTTSESNTLTGKPASVSDTAIQAADARAMVPDVDWIESSDSRLRAGRIYVERATLPGDGRPRLRLELFSDYRYAPGLRLRVELRRNRFRSDIPLGVQMLDLPAPVAIRDSPFMVAQYLYSQDLAIPNALDLAQAYTLYIRVINADGLPVTEEQSLRFRVPRPKPPEVSTARR